LDLLILDGNTVKAKNVGNLVYGFADFSFGVDDFLDSV
jgi:hypothetical protein